MSRMKKTTKRTRGESSVEPPPWNHPLARYFASNEDLVYYEMRLAGRKEIPPRYLDPNLLVTQNFDHLREILEYQGIMNFVQIRDKYYPDLVAIVYSTLMIEVNEENESDFSLVFKLGKDEYELGCSELAIIWGLPNQGCLFEGGKTPIGDWGYSKENAMGIFNLTQVSGHATVCDEDLIIMWAMVNNIKINWSYFIVQHMIRLKKKETSGGLGYLCLWTRIFNRVGIDLTNEKVKHVPSQSCIDIRLLRKMGRSRRSRNSRSTSTSSRTSRSFHEGFNASPSKD
ncbi:hypothetical protein PIB30_108404 [Stylosanthes scabra]|uniref:Uncharacterized protein n=1 Tax=Stylosanthes scabra TaxID=79078 RepID=A0ABU6U1V5_9FABA|nr:hypothetical protein [Stylosanthes scabra]